MSRLTEGTSPTEINLEGINLFIKAFETAGGTLEDLVRMTTNLSAARAAILANRRAWARPTADQISPTPYDEPTIRAMLASMSVPDDLFDRYSQPSEFSRLIAENPKHLGERALQALSHESKTGTLPEMPPLTREKVRQLASNARKALMMAIIFDRPPLIEALDKAKVPLKTDERELIELLG